MSIISNPNTHVQTRGNLVLCLDAANSKSYPGSGTVWYDLAQGLVFNSTGTMTPYSSVGGVPCFDFNGSGYWYCDSGYDQVDLGADFTFEFWYYCEAESTRRTIFQKQQTVHASYEQELAVTVETNNTWSMYSRYTPHYDYAVTTALTQGQWNCVIATVSNGYGTADRVGYYSLNGGSLTSFWTSQSSYPLIPATTIVLGSGYAGVMEVGYVARVCVYDFMFSESDKDRVFNAMRGRFGI